MYTGDSLDAEALEANHNYWKARAVALEADRLKDRDKLAEGAHFLRDALDEAERTAENWMRGFKNELEFGLKLMDELACWKAWAEALERALRRQDPPCYTCEFYDIKDGAKRCSRCNGGDMWESGYPRGIHSDAPGPLGEIGPTGLEGERQV